MAVNPTRYQSEIRQLKKSLSSECDCIARSNIAGTYRMAGNRRRAFEWWQRAAAMQVILSGRTVSDGSAFLELGYCYQYGTGVRRDERAARTAYRSAVRSQWINEYSREEALYHLAVAYLDLDSAQGRRQAAKYLREAAADGDYPQAADLLARLESGEALFVCRCRRGLRRSLGGKAQCALHARAGRPRR